MKASIPAFCAEPEGLPAAAMRRSRLSAWFRVDCHSTHLYLGLFADCTKLLHRPCCFFAGKLMLVQHCVDAEDSSDSCCIAQDRGSLAIL